MSKYKTMMFALLAIFAFSAVAATSASAHTWLTLAGAEVTTATAATSDSELLLLKVTGISGLLGGGEVTVDCDGKFKGTVGPGTADSVTEIEDLAGAKTKIKCKVAASTNSFCKTTNEAEVEAVNLPWKTALILLTNEQVHDDFTTKVGSEKVGYKVTCNGLSNECAVALETSTFHSNLSTGADFVFESGIEAACTTGKGTVKGLGIVLGFLVN
jgi:hypothetical protein